MTRAHASVIARRDAARGAIAFLGSFLWPEALWAARDSKAESGTSRHTHSGNTIAALEPGPPLARRLWEDLFCMCGECRNVTLANCGCDDAAKERRWIVEHVERMGLGTPEREESTYAAVLGEYVKRHGAEATVARAKLRAWLDPLLALAAVVAGFIAILVVVQRLRSTFDTSGSKRPTRHPRKQAKRRS